METRGATLQTVQSTGGGHLTEDAAWAGVYESHAVMVVADGAPVRLRPMPSLQPLLDKFSSIYSPEITPSGIASRLIRDTVAQHATAHPPASLKAMVTQANQHLADELAAVYGELSAQAIVRQEPQFTILAEDERYIRLTLPASTYTVVRANWVSNHLEVAHGADSALIVIRDDGSCEQITPDQMAQHDHAAKKLWMAQPDAPAQHPFFRELGDNRGMETNRVNGLYHNYIGPNGELDRAVGVSVVDGLPQVVDYMFAKEMPLDGIRALLVISDGMYWPKPLDTPEEVEKQHLQDMVGRIMREGLTAYVGALRAEETRVRESGLNPYQWHDDATGLLLHLPRQ